MDLILKILKPFLITYTRIDFYVYTKYSKRLPFSYRIFRKSFVVSGGKINDLLTQKIIQKNQRISNKEINNLPNFNLGISKEKKDFLKEMQINGFYIFKTVLEAEALECLSNELNKIPDEYLDAKTGTYKLLNDNIPTNKRRKNSRDLWQNEYIRNFAVNREFIELADAYLESRPICDLIASWKSYPTNDQYLKNKAAQMYHFDMDRIKFVKFFIYLTNVTTETGPHCYIKSSHLSLPKGLRMDGRFNDDDIINHYTISNEIEICGLQGSIIAVDTRGFHKGKPLSAGERELIQFEYTNSLYGNDQYEQIEIPITKVEKIKRSLIGA